MLALSEMEAHSPQHLRKMALMPFEAISSIVLDSVLVCKVKSISLDLGREILRELECRAGDGP